MKRAGLIFALLLLCAAASTDEERAQELEGQIRCTVCQSESVRDSQADMARDLRLLIREKVAAGWSDSQILGYVQRRYGDFILLRPPFQPNTWFLWLAPILFLAGAGLYVFRFLARGRGRR